MTNTLRDASGSSVKAAVSFAEEHELPRKLLHGSIAPLTISLYLSGTQVSSVTPVLVKALVPIAGCEVLRNVSPAFNRAYIAVCGPLMRESEKQGRINGVIYYLVGLITVFASFPKDLSILSVLLLSWADLAASSVGRKFGKYTPQLVNGKSLAGSLGAFLAGMMCCFLLYGYLLPKYSHFNTNSSGGASLAFTPASSRLSLVWLSVATGVVAAVSELFPILDDNMSIPIVSATILSVIIRLCKA